MLPTEESGNGVDKLCPPKEVDIRHCKVVGVADDVANAAIFLDGPRCRKNGARASLGFDPVKFCGLGGGPDPSETELCLCSLILGGTTARPPAPDN